MLIIGGGIANFTNVASTFKGVVRALKDYRHRLLQTNVKIFVRRAGPNYQVGRRGPHPAPLTRRPPSRKGCG